MKITLALKDAILAAYSPEVIILFGSLGRGDADEFSDVDLLVVIDTVSDLIDLSEEISAFTDSITSDKHIILKSVNDYFYQSDIPGTIVFAAIEEGQILFERKDLWKRRPHRIEPYEKRKRVVIQREYIQQAYDFFDQAESALKNEHLFRFRDFARFSAIRAIKGLFVKHDLHPPRETDLNYLTESAKRLEPRLDGYAMFIEELNSYCPDKNSHADNLRSTGMLHRMIVLLKDVTSW